MKKTIKIILAALFLIILLGVATLLILPAIQNKTMHRKAVAFLQDEFDSAVVFQDFSISYLRSFPRVRVGLTEVQVFDRGQVVIAAGRVDLVLNLRKLIWNRIEVEKLIIDQARLRAVVDSLGNKMQVFARKKDHGSPTGFGTKITSGDLEIRNSHLYFGNDIKKNRTYLTIEEARLNLDFGDSLVLIEGRLQGHLDSLISNNTLLFKGQPVRGEEVLFSINRATGAKKIESGYLLAHSVRLFPRLTMVPYEDGQMLELHIIGDGNFNDFLELFEFHLGFDLQQTNPQAELHLSYNQKGFVNPFLRPYSELDFDIRDGVFEGEDLPYPIENINISGNYNNGAAHSPETVELVIDTLQARVAGSFVDARFKLTNLHDPYIDANLKASLELSHLVKTSDDLQVQGKIEADLALNGKINELKALHLEGKQAARGTIRVEDLKLVMNDQDITLEMINGSSMLNNHIFEITSLVGAFNRSAFHFNGQFENLGISILNREEDIAGTFKLSFSELDLTTLDFGRFKSNNKGTAGGFPLSFMAFDFRVQGDRIITPYGDVKNLDLNGSLDEKTLTLNQLSLDYQEGSLFGSAALGFGDPGIESVDARLTGDFRSLVLDIPGRPAKNDSTAVAAFSWPRNVNASLDLRIKDGEIQKLAFGNLNLQATMSDHQVFLHQFSADLWEGHSALAGSIRINESGIESIRLKGDLDFNQVDLTSLLQKNTDGGRAGTPAFPDDINLDVHVRAKKINYHDLTLKDLQAQLNADKQQVELSGFSAALPFGVISLDATVLDYRKKTPEFKGTLSLLIDSLDVEDDILKLEALARDSGNGTDVAPGYDSGKRGLRIPENVNLDLTLQAAYVNYSKMAMKDIELRGGLSNGGAELEKLTLGFSDGNFEMKGNLKPMKEGGYAGYAYSRGNEVDIQQVFRSFQNFGQDLFTDKNTSGKIATASHYYFKLDNNMQLEVKENLWLLNLFVNHLEFDQVEPIEKTLFFVGHKSKDKMLVHELNLNAYVIADRIYFRDIYMNDNIADLGVFGEVDTEAMEMDLSLEISLTDLFFRTQRKKKADTDQGLYSLDKDSKLYLHLFGPLKDHKMRMISKRNFNRKWDKLEAHMKKTTEAFRKEDHSLQAE